MKKAIKIMSLVLAVLMCMFAVVGCGAQKKDDDTASTGSTASTAPQKTIVVGYTIYAPMNYFDENDKLIGYDTELAEKVFTNLGYKPIFKEIDWESKYTDLNAGTIDCIWNGFTCNSKDTDGIERSAKVDFSYNYMENRQVLVVKKDSGITSADKLSKKIILAEAGSAGETYAKTFKGGVFKSVSKQTNALFEVNANTADVAVLDAQLAKSYVGKGDYKDLVIVDALSSDVEYYAIGFKKGSELTAKVNSELEKLGADGTIEALATKYGVATTAIKDFSDQK